MDGDRHWIYGENVTRNMVCVAIKVPTAKLRDGPGVDGQLSELRQVDRYTPFKRLDLSGDWAQVEASWGEIYWVHTSNLWRPVRVSQVGF